MKRIVIVVLATVVLLGGVLGFSAFRKVMIAKFLASMPEPVMSVSVVPAKSEVWDRTIAAIGTLEAVNGVQISSSVSGLVEDISFESGQKVSKGQKLVVLDYDVEQANLRQVEARVELNALTLNRTRSLRQTDAASQAKLDEAAANLRAAQAEAEALRATIAKKTVTAPFSGALGIRQIDRGQYLQPGQTIVDIQDLSEILLTATVPQSVFPQLGVGQTVRAAITAYPDRVFEGSLSALEPSVDDSGLIKIQARFDNRDGLLRPGMFAKASIVIPGHDDVIVLPQPAISFSLYGDHVFVIVKDEKGDTRVERREIKTGLRINNEVAILDGLKAGEQVVASGALKLNNKSKVKIVESDDALQASPKIGHE